MFNDADLIVVHNFAMRCRAFHESYALLLKFCFKILRLACPLVAAAAVCSCLRMKFFDMSGAVSCRLSGRSNQEFLDARVQNYISLEPSRE